MSPVLVQFIKLYMKRMTTVSATKMPPICAWLNTGTKSVASIWYITTDNTPLSSRHICCKFSKQCLKFYFCVIFSSTWKKPFIAGSHLCPAFEFDKLFHFISPSAFFAFCKRNLWFVYRVSLQIMFVNWFFFAVKNQLKWGYRKWDYDLWMDFISDTGYPSMNIKPLHKIL